GILVEAGKVSTSVLHLQTGCKIKGKVVNADGSPSANLDVSCHSAARPHSGGIESVETKGDGTFEFFLPPGRAYFYVIQYVKKTKLNPFGVGNSAHAYIKVSATEDAAPIELKLQASESKFGDTEWLNRSTPGTQIVRRIGNQDVTGTVVDADGKPIKDAMVFREDGPIVKTNEKGEFRVETLKGTQFIMHAFAPGHHLWFGTPTSGDMLKIVLEPKSAPIPAKEKPKSDPPVKGVKVWPHFAKMVGDDKAARELFDRIVANPANLAILEKTTGGDPDLLKTYLVRRDELNTAAKRKNPPLDEIAAWLLLGTYPGTTGGDDTLLRFLDFELASNPLFVDAAGVDAMGAKSPVGQPLRKLVAVWLANHSDEFSAVKAGLGISVEYDIPEALTIARRVIKGITGTKLVQGPQANSSLMLRGLGMLVVGKYGSKDDVALLQPYFKDGGEFYAIIREKPGERRPGYAVPIEGKDVTIQVGDVALAMAIHLRGGDPREFRFLWPTALDGVKITGPYRLGMIGFISTADRTVAHKKAKEWLEKPPM
ncbi:MAG TPA: carboxypeptidase-like regulatory domain-containing protein, partial [Gemmata sp.]|nr:carboxypeptidase-like regulatory domain-containing protein [Gemmata sp.]